MKGQAKNLKLSYRYFYLITFDCNNTAFIDAMTEDWNRFLSVVQTDKEGNHLNIIKVDGVDSADEKVIGKRLQEIAKNATTGGLYTQVGEFYGFPIKVVSERILKEGLEFTDNRFVVEGNYKYTYNNGHLALADPLAAARNFLNAIERIPSIIDQYKAKNEVLEREIPQLQEIAGKVWKKEEELKQLKSELAALDRKIQLELAPPTPEITEKEHEGQQVKPEYITANTQSIGKYYRQSHHNWASGAVCQGGNPVQRIENITLGILSEVLIRAIPKGLKVNFILSASICRMATAFFFFLGSPY